jgi:hypothetical protein
MLGLVYQKSVDSYNGITKKLEDNGIIDHLKANIRFSKDLKYDKVAEHYPKSVVSRLHELHRSGTLTMKRTTSDSL